MTDTHEKLANKLGLDQTPFHIYLVGDQQKVLFSADLADPDDIRQLSDKYLLGRVTYPSLTHPDVHHLVGEQLVSFPVTRIRDSTQVQLFADPSVTSAPRNFLIFTARCPDCSLEGLVRASADYDPPGHQTPALIFSSRFALWQVKDLLAQFNKQTDSYQARGSIPGIEDLSSLTVFVPSDACLVSLSQNNTIIAVLPLVLVSGHLKELPRETSMLRN